MRPFQVVIVSVGVSDRRAAESFEVFTIEVEPDGDHQTCNRRICGSLYMVGMGNPRRTLYADSDKIGKR